MGMGCSIPAGLTDRELSWVVLICEDVRLSTCSPIYCPYHMIYKGKTVIHWTSANCHWSLITSEGDMEALSSPNNRLKFGRSSASA